MTKFSNTSRPQRLRRVTTVIMNQGNRTEPRPPGRPLYPSGHHKLNTLSIRLSRVCTGRKFNNSRIIRPRRTRLHVQPRTNVGPFHLVSPQFFQLSHHVTGHTSRTNSTYARQQINIRLPVRVTIINQGKIRNSSPANEPSNDNRRRTRIAST